MSRHIKINDFTYTENKDLLFDIGYDKEKHPYPDEFFKYYSLSPNSVSAVTQNYLYASHPAQLNDPFDCDKSLIDIDDKLTQDYLLEKIRDYIVKNKWTAEDIHSFANEYYYPFEYRRIGIVSLTTKPENELMWAHYATSKGFCVSFNIKNLPFKHYGVFPINYVPDIQTIKTSDVGIKIATAIQCTIKSANWKYEDEWRLIVSNPPGDDFESFGTYASDFNAIGYHDRKMSYPLDAINYVILGFCFVSDFDRVTGTDPTSYYFKRKFKCCSFGCHKSREKEDEQMRCEFLDFLITNNIKTKAQIKTSTLGHYETKEILLQKVNIYTYSIKLIDYP